MSNLCLNIKANSTMGYDSSVHLRRSKSPHPSKRRLGDAMDTPGASWVLCICQWVKLSAMFLVDGDLSPDSVHLKDLNRKNLKLLMEPNVKMSPNNTDFSEVKSSIVIIESRSHKQKLQVVCDSQLFQHLHCTTWLMCGKKMTLNRMLWIWLLIPMV